MDDAMRRKAIGVGFVSSFFIHAALMTSIMMIAGNTLDSTGKLLTVVLDARGFSVGGGIGGNNAVGIPADPIRRKTCAPPDAGRARDRKPAAPTLRPQNPTTPPAAVQTPAAKEAAPVAEPLPTASSPHDFVVEQTAVADGPATSSGESNGVPIAPAVAGGKAGGEADFGTAVGRPGTGHAAGGPGGSGALQRTTGGGDGGKTAGIEAAKARYMKERFHYIRDLILRNIDYPLIARRMGWKGSVTVAFIIGEAGYVENIRIVHGSGHKILDESTVKAIEKIQPFPKPPGRAEIVIPIEYRLG